jgi:signal transduction histidine kinase
VRASEARLPVVYVLAGYLVVLGYYRVPSPDGVRWLPKLVLYGAVSFSAVVAICVGVWLYRPERRLPWLLFALSQCVYFAADVAFYTYHDALHDERYPAPADALYLAHYPFLVAGLLLLRRQRSRQWAPLIDTLIVGIAAALLVWIVLMSPYASGHSMGLLVRLTSLAYPVMDLMVLVAAVRLIANGLRSPSMSFPATGLVALLCSDFVYSWLQVKGHYVAGDFLDATWPTYSLCLGAAALHPSMRRVSAGGETPRSELRRSRLVLLALASLGAPAAMAVEKGFHKPVHVLPAAAASALLFLLVVARLAEAARDQKRAQAEKARLLARVVEVAEQERMRVAGDLHDGPIQKLTVATMRLELLASQIARGELEQAQASARRIREDLVGEMDSLRRLMSNLRPPVLDERGVTPALGDCVRQVLDVPELEVRIESSVEGRLAPELETVLYRVAREALVNVRKHADARNVVVRLERSGDLVALSIEDDGVGFDGARFAQSPKGHLGLTGIRERAESVGGHAHVTSTPGAGTCVEVAVPYRGDVSEARAA